MQEQNTFYELKDWKVLKISGPDAQDFLQRMSTLDMRTLQIGEVKPAAFLTGRGTCIALVFIGHHDGQYSITIPWGRGERTLEHLEQFHFQENLKIEPSDSTIIAVEGSSKEGWPDPILPYRYLGLRGRSPKQSSGDMNKYEKERILHCVPKIGVDLLEKELILAAPVEWAISRNKGCYPGQEVVERIFTYGKVQHQLKTVELEGEFESQGEFEQGGKIALDLRSRLRITPEKGIGIAMVSRAFWESSDLFFSPSGAKAKILK